MINDFAISQVAGHIGDTLIEIIKIAIDLGRTIRRARAGTPRASSDVIDCHVSLFSMVLSRSLISILSSSFIGLYLFTHRVCCWGLVSWPGSLFGDQSSPL